MAIDTSYMPVEQRGTFVCKWKAHLDDILEWLRVRLGLDPKAEGVI